MTTQTTIVELDRDRMGSLLITVRSAQKSKRIIRYLAEYSDCWGAPIPFSQVGEHVQAYVQTDYVQEEILNDMDITRAQRRDIDHGWTVSVRILNDYLLNMIGYDASVNLDLG